MGQKSPSDFGAEQLAVDLLPLEPISETDIFVCASGMTDRIKKIEGHHAQTIAHHSAQYLITFSAKPYTLNVQGKKIKL